MLFFRLIAFRVCIQKRPKIGKERKWKNHQDIVSLLSMSFVFRIGQLRIHCCYMFLYKLIRFSITKIQCFNVVISLINCEFLSQTS